MGPGSYYWYAETSSPVRASDKFRLSYDGSVCGSHMVMSISFSYHMYGTSIGTLEVKGAGDQTGSNNGVGTTKWSKSGQQSISWQTVVDVAVASPSFFFEYSKSGSSYRGDAAIGEVSVLCGSGTVTTSKTSSLDVRTRSTKTENAPAAVCAAREYSQSSPKTGQDVGTVFGPSSASEATCKVNTPAAQAGFYSIEVKQS